MIVGAHIPGKAPFEEAARAEAGCIQMFLGPPQSWKQPPVRADAEELGAAPFPIYVHAPYPVNVASPNNRIRIPSRKILAGALERAEEIGAAGLIVHGGHAEDGVHRGFMRWRKVFEELRGRVPILIENTAGGDNAMTRHVDVLAELWSNLTDFEVGFCFDTCHAHAAGEDLATVVPRVLDITGRIDLFHANDSRDPPGTGADRHANFADGHIGGEAILDMVEQAGAPAVICETPWPHTADDIAWLKERL